MHPVSDGHRFFRRRDNPLRHFTSHHHPVQEDADRDHTHTHKLWYLPHRELSILQAGARYAPPACVDNCRTKPVELVRNGKSVIRLPGAGPRMESSFMAERRRARTREGYMPTTYFLSTVGWGMRWNYRIWNMPFMRPCQKVERKLSYEMRDATTRIHLTALRREGSD